MISIEGPTNCVVVAAEALRKLGRGEPVRDALAFVKKTSPHRRLTQQRRRQQEQQQQQEQGQRQQEPRQRQQEQQRQRVICH